MRSRVLFTRGPSAGKAILDSSQVEVQSVEASQIALGDLAVYELVSKIRICHRVIGKRWTSEGYQFETMGDANSLSDGWVSGSSFIGTVTAVNGTKFKESESHWKRYKIVVKLRMKNRFARCIGRLRKLIFGGNSNVS